MFHRYINYVNKIIYTSTENAPDITTNLCIPKRSLYKDDSPYNLRGSQAFLIELDPNEVDEVEAPVQQESEYYNVKVTRIPVDQLWETIQNKRSKGELEMEYEVFVLNFLIWTYCNIVYLSKFSVNRKRTSYIYRDFLNAVIFFFL